jgi:hypothetical protein
MLASVAGEVAVVAVDHGQAGAHVAGEVEGGDTGTEREGGEGVSEIVNPAQRLDPGRELCGFPVVVAEVVQVADGVKRTVRRPLAMRADMQGVGAPPNSVGVAGLTLGACAQLLSEPGSVVSRRRSGWNRRASSRS